MWILSLVLKFFVMVLDSWEGSLLKQISQPWVWIQEKKILFQKLFLGAIAFLACKQKLCKKCQRTGQPFLHEKHDFWFRKTGIAIVICLTWCFSLAASLPDELGVTGEVKWTSTFYGCDAVYRDGHFGYGLMANIVLNVINVIIGYSLVCWRIYQDKIDGEEVSQVINYNKHIRMIFTLAISYTGDILIFPIIRALKPFYISLVCVLPASFLCWGFFSIDSWFNKDKPSEKQIFLSCINLLYWSLYCINFILYLCSYNRIRDAYRRFLEDTKIFICSSKSSGLSPTTPSNSLLHLSRMKSHSLP